ncbi:hypothetical protein DPEC_G00197200 [Dallia pectoralis]|uniref:Uncharacterized protein n=1 Tax=Dallia pectoralis TaxID=75939 RepID=A0ACC2G817_DALPE|nr:hypothetical protein DPEC_G00197200 [Dallia pectoralis]
MGANSSTPEPAPASPVTQFEKPWRKTDWSKTNRDNMVETLRNFDLKDLNLGQLRCLLLGPIGSGKSSFINSVNNVFQGRIAHSALAAASYGTSFTRTYNTHYIQNEPKCLPFVFNDIMGLEEQNGLGIHPDDLISALRGHLPEGYAFNPVTPLREESRDYKKHPNIEDKVHCLVNVIPADKLSFISTEVIEKITKIRAIATELGVPQVVVLTMPDKACDLVGNDLQKIYTSIEIKKKMQICSNYLGVPMDCILAVKNYHEEDGLNDDLDILILTAMSRIMNVAKDFMWMEQKRKTVNNTHHP